MKPLIYKNIQTLNIQTLSRTVLCRSAVHCGAGVLQGPLCVCLLSSFPQF